MSQRSTKEEIRDTDGCLLLITVIAIIVIVGAFIALGHATTNAVEMMGLFQ